ncbi:MAG: hypothetical protein IPL34_20185 [Thiofilum sp.]|uniref:hypothetical protein n=1 Tax=Thiofilum sp. TaxID=2212733 RepID=UPI0025D19E9A|nr:hypothetical protein [Thiofilum sp.]MBK8455601.1 hypothetical protein [Thiofilum sp.]
MDTDLKKLRKLVKFMQKEGVLVLKVREIEIQLSKSALFHVEHTKEPVETTATDLPDENQYTEEELLFWSAPGILEDSH